MRSRGAMWGVILGLIFTAALARAGEVPIGARGVVLIHGLARSAHSLKTMESALTADGYLTLNIDYPSTEHSMAVLCRDYLAPQINAFSQATEGPLSFVTHSMGGILLRYMVKEAMIGMPYRAVMLSPPNQGSEVVDRLGGLWLFRVINGPAGHELGTGGDQMPASLGPVTFELGVITGTRTINFILSALIPGPDDGKVAVDRARVEGMSDFRPLSATHPFIMKNRCAIRQTRAFLNRGQFTEPSI